MHSWDVTNANVVLWPAAARQTTTDEADQLQAGCMPNRRSIKGREGKILAFRTPAILKHT